MTMDFLTTYDRRRNRGLFCKGKFRLFFFLMSELKEALEPPITLNIAKTPYLFKEYGLNIFQSSTALYSLERLQLNWTTDLSANVREIYYEDSYPPKTISISTKHVILIVKMKCLFLNCLDTGRSPIVDLFVHVCVVWERAGI